jgi:hypothetical protein
MAGILTDKASLSSGKEADFSEFFVPLFKNRNYKFLIVIRNYFEMLHNNDLFFSASGKTHPFNAEL